MEKCHQQGTFRDHHGSHLPGKPGLCAGTTGLERDPVHPGGQGMGQASRRALLWGRQVGGVWLRCRVELSRERTALADFIHSLFFLKAEVSCGSCPGAVRTGDSTVRKQYPLAAAAAVCTSNSSFPFTSHPTPLFADVFARKGRQVCGCVIHTDIGV